MAVHSFEALMDESPISLPVHSFVALMDESPISLPDVNVTADPLNLTLDIAGTFQGHIFIVVNPLNLYLTLQGNFRAPTEVSVTADPLTLTLSLAGSFYNADSAVDPLELTLILEGRSFIVPSSNPPTYKIELRDSDDVLQFVFVDKIENIQWSYLRLGGCEQASFVVIDPPSGLDETDIQNYDVRIYLDVGPGIKIWWRGHIEDARLQLGEPYRMTIVAKGAYGHLERVAIVGLGFPVEDGAVLFENLDAVTIAKQLIDKANSLGADITYTNSSTPPSGFVIESIQFNSSIFSALKTLGELAGNAEWGVDRNKEFFFRDGSSVTGNAFLLGKDIESAEHSYNTQDLINRIYLVGGDDYRAVVEDTSVLTTDQSQLLDNATQAFGQATSNQRVCQPFTPTKNSFSVLSLKIGKTGWGSNLVTDGDMELNDGSSPPNWPEPWPRRTKRKKFSSNPHAGTRCLEVRHARIGKGRYGVYQDVTVTAEQEVQFVCWLRDPEREEPVVVELFDGSAARSSTATVIDRFQNSQRSTTWYQVSMGVTPSTTTLGIRIYAHNKKGGTGNDPFYIDDVSVQDASDVSVSIVEQLTAGPPPTFDEDNPIAQIQINFQDIASTPAVISLSMVASPLDSTKTYGILIESLGQLSDTQYFTLAYQNTLTGLVKDNGDGVWNTVSGKSYFKTELPTSQVTWGVRSEVINQPHINNDDDAGLWGASILATKSSPIERASIKLRTNKNIMIEEVIPVEQVRIAAATSARAVDFTLVPERISYSLSEAGLEIMLELGDVFPRIGKIFQWLEYRLALLGE